VEIKHYNSKKPSNNLEVKTSAEKTNKYLEVSKSVLSKTLICLAVLILFVAAWVNFMQRPLSRDRADFNYFEIKKGEFFGIVGRNGSGKSTLLKMLAGIYKPTEGSITVNGSLTPFIELGVGFNPELTGRENVYLNGALLGFNNKEMN
jgi:ABC-type multidrug transport system fused ATPase/permease subunit